MAEDIFSQILSTDKITVAGTPGYGKTVLTKLLAALLMPGVRVWDPLDQYGAFPAENRYVPTVDNREEFDGWAKQFLTTANINGVIEEAEQYLPEGRDLPEAFGQAARRGRNWGVGFVANTRRVQDLSKKYFGLCTSAFLFRCGMDARTYLSGQIGREHADTVMALERYQFMFWRPDADPVVATLKIPEGETV